MENYLSASVQNQLIQSKVKESIEKLFPIESKNGKILEISNIRIEDNLDDYDFPQQKEIKLNRTSWQIPIYADFVIRDKNNNRIINKATQIKIGNLPKITNRYSVIVDGNEYQVLNQIRRRPGVYTREKRNGELISEFNLAKGKNFTLELNPETEIFELKFKNRGFRLWTLLNALGATDKELEKAWGKPLLETNKRNALNTEYSHLAGIYKIIFNKEPKDMLEIITKLKSYFTDQTLLDPMTTKITLGEEHQHVTKDTLIKASIKLLNIHKKIEEPDEKDNLVFKKIYSTDDLLVDYFDKNTLSLKKKLEIQLNFKDDIKTLVNSTTFSTPIKKFFTTSELSNPTVQTNPVMILAEWRKTTPMGAGGIQNTNAITMDIRDVHPTHFGFLDPTASPEGGKIGVTVALSENVIKQDNELKTQIIEVDSNNKPNLVFFSPIEMYDNIVAFGDQYIYKPETGTIHPRYDTISAMHKGKFVRVPANQVKYYLSDAKRMFAIHTNLIPFLQNTQGNRTSTGARMITQALPLKNPDKPLVLNISHGNISYEERFVDFLNPKSPVDGKVTKITDDYIFITDNNNKTHKIGLFNNFPLNQDGFLHSTPLVKEGDTVTKNQVLADNNYSVDKTLSLGKNLTVAYMNYKGWNHDDGIVITESAAKALTHETIHKENINFNPKQAIFDKTKFIMWFPEVLNKENAEKLDDKGIVKIGTQVNPGDVIAAFLVEKELDDSLNNLRKLHKTIFSNYMKNVTYWENQDPGVVTDVRINGRNIDIYIKAEHPLKEGDKLSSLWGNKGVVTKIIPDAEAPRRENGEPIQVMLSPEGVPGRMNIGQILYTAATKIAEKTGQPYKIKNFSDPDKDWAKTIYNEMKSLGIEPNEYLIDGKTNKPIETPIFVGKQYIIKLRHVVDKKEGLRGINEVYDINEQPANTGAQKIGNMELYAMLAHGAKANLWEMANIKGRKNEEYWRNLQLGLTPPKPARNFVFNKFVNYLKAAGVNVEKKGNNIQIFPLTDQDVEKMSNGELTDPGALLIGKNLTSRPGGLFDEQITGGLNGTNWAHINLATRIPNPMYEDAIKKALDLTDQKFNQIIQGKEQLNGLTGSEAIIKALENINVNKEIEKLKQELKTAPETYVNKLNSKIKNFQALQNLNMSPVEAYTINKLPVLPPTFRPIIPLPSGDLMVNSLNKHYRDVGLINNTFKEVKDFLTEEDKHKSTFELYQSVKALQGFIDPITYSQEKYKGIMPLLGTQKYGLVQGNMMAVRQDLSARSTIVINPDLGINEVGLPKEMAYKIFQPFIIKEMKEIGLSASEALKHYQNQTDLALNTLQNIVKDRPVLLNRAPSLHKHSIQALMPRIVEGKAIQMNPLIAPGFNFDIDGDTMAVHVPVTPEAVAEAKDMLPTKIIFKHGDFSMVPELAKAYIHGIYLLSKITGHTGKKFNSVEEAKAANIRWTDTFELNGRLTTIGQELLNEPLPPEMRDYTRVLDTKTAHNILEKLAKIKSPNFEKTFNTWKELGAEYSYFHGETISITDFIGDKSYRDNLLKIELPKIEKIKDQEQKINAYIDLIKKVENLQNEHIKHTNIYELMQSGAFKKPDSVRQILTMPGILTDIEGKPIDYPVTKSYGEGIDAASYWNTLYAVRKGTVDRSVKTQDSGALNKELLSVTRKTIITMDDCGTTEGLEMEVDDKYILDRCLLETVPKVGKRNDVITTEVIMNAKTNNIFKLPVRSPLTCKAPGGICVKCYGLLPDGIFPQLGTNVGILESAALTERASQLTMQTFHTGGSLTGGGGSGILSGFPRTKQLLEVPEYIPNKALIAPKPGIITAVYPNEIGGYNIELNGQVLKSAPGLLPKVKMGDKVKAGDPLTEGTIKPQELSEYKSHLDAQKYITEELAKIYNKFHKKSIETVVRSFTDNAIITEAPEDSGFLRGDHTRISIIQDINAQRKRNGIEPIKYKPYLKSINILNVYDDDWLTRASTNRFKDAITQGAARGAITNIKGRDPIPAFIYAEEFGKDFNPEKGQFY